MTVKEFVSRLFDFLDLYFLAQELKAGFFFYNENCSLKVLCSFKQILEKLKPWRGDYFELIDNG